MAAHFHIRDAMLSVLIQGDSLWTEVMTDATISFHSVDETQRESRRDMCIQNMERMRDKLNDLISDAKRSAEPARAA